MDPTLERLEVYQSAHDLALRIHSMSFQLPFFEQHEEAPQVRRSAKRVAASIVEGLSQRKYKGLLLSYFYRALGSSDETQEHLKLLFKSGSLKNPAVYKELSAGYEMLSRKLFRFIRGVESHHESPNYLSSPSLPPEDDE